MLPLLRLELARWDAGSKLPAKDSGSPSVDGPAGEGLGRTARMHVPEESDSGIVPMSHPN